MTQNRRIIAVIGGIGSGKSTVCALLSKKGYVVVDCDKLAREVALCADVLEEISATFGSSLVSDGALDRRELRKQVFNDGKLLDKLNNIFFARTAKRLKEVLDEMHDQTIFVEVSVYREELRGLFNEVWLVDAKENVRTKRVATRDNIDEDAVISIINKQTQNTMFDIVIENNGTITQLTEKIEKLLSQDHQLSWWLAQAPLGHNTGGA